MCVERNDFMNIGYRIRKRREELGLSQEELANRLGYKSRSTINKIEAGVNDIVQSKIIAFAEALNTTPAYLMGWEENADVKSETNLYASGIPDNIYMIPVFDSVSAGFGALAEDYIVDYMPAEIRCGSEAGNYIYINVKGDSMSPLIDDGSRILVHKQESVDSGSVAVVLVDGEEALVKKVNYGKTWIELISINPYYPPRRFENEEVLRLRVLGLVKGIFKPMQ